MMWNSELRNLYGYNWESEALEDGKERLEKLLERTQKYISRFKKKELIVDIGCFNQKLSRVALNDKYELTFFFIDDEQERMFRRINLQDIIEKNYCFRYDRKYHVLTLG